MAIDQNGTQVGRRSHINDVKSDLRRDDEIILSYGISLSTLRKDSTGSAMKYIVLGLGQDGKVYKGEDIDGDVVKAMYLSNEKWYCRTEMLNLPSKFPGLASVDVLEWEPNVNHGQYVQSRGEGTSKVWEYYLEKLTGASATIPGHVELKAAELSAKDAAAHLKKEQSLTPEHKTAFMQSFLKASATMGVNREDFLGAVKAYRPDVMAKSAVAAQPAQHVTHNHE